MDGLVADLDARASHLGQAARHHRDGPGRAGAGAARTLRQGGAAAAYGLGDAGGPDRYGREGHHQYPHLHGWTPSAGSGAAVDALAKNLHDPGFISYKLFLDASRLEELMRAGV